MFGSKTKLIKEQEKVIEEQQILIGTYTRIINSLEEENRQHIETISELTNKPKRKSKKEV